MFIIQEIQTSNNNQIAITPALTKETYKEAESAFYSICGSAVLSGLPKHTVVTLYDEGNLISELTKCFFN